MRIIGGSAGGRNLKVPRGMGVRPTPDLVRQAIFNSLGDRVVDARVLELFGGTGALGLECLSRGAQQVICIEKSAKHAGFIRGNARQAGLDGPTFQVRVMDAFDAIRQLGTTAVHFDLVMADPPYGEKNVSRRSESFAQRVLDDARLPGLIAPHGLLVLGHARRDAIEVPPRWCEIKALKHGDSIFRMLQVVVVSPVESGVPPV